MLIGSANLRHIATVTGIGVIVGVVAFALALVLDKYVFTPIGCATGSSIVRCENVTSISHNVALLVALGVGLTLLVRVAAFRPLLVILGSVIALWGMGARLSMLSWPAGLVLSMLIFGLIFALFTWLALVRRFWISAVLVTVTVILLRLALAL